MGRNCLHHGGGKVFLTAGKVNVVLRHPTCCVSHEFSEGFDVHSIDDRLGAEMVADAVQLHVVWQFGSLAEPPHSQAKIRPIPYGSVCRHEHMRSAGALVLMD